jgi:predicted transposase YbfD/YdcC
MIQEQRLSLADHFEELVDPRIDRTKKHQLLDIVIIAVCAVICGADDWVGVERFGRAKQSWLGTILELPNGIPSHDTFGRVFGCLNPEQFQHCFINWVQALVEVTCGQVIAVDGKKLRRSHNKRQGKAAIHMVSAWATENRLVLGQLKVDEKSNEITAIPELLQALVIHGCIITIDAMGCQTEIADLIVEQGGDYCISLKGNQGTLHRDVQDLFAYAQEIQFRDVAHDVHQTTDKDHGRLEVRRYTTIFEPEFIQFLDPTGKWAGLRSIGMVETRRELAEQISRDTRYFIASLSGNAVEFGHAVRDHWHIENSLHWVLDVAFREDDCRVRQGYAAQNFAIIRHIALNLLRREQTAQCGIKNKRLQAAWDEPYLFKVLSA